MQSSYSRILAVAMLLALILAIGAMVVWVVSCVVITQTVSQWQSRSLKGITITSDNDVLIYHQESDGIHTYETLDGKPVTDMSSIRFESGSISVGSRKFDIFETEPLWSARIAGFSDTQRTFWYLIANGQQPGRAYFVGYDSRSKRKIGYLGLNGYSNELPAERYQFAIGGEKSLHGTYANLNQVMAEEPWINPQMDRNQARAYVISHGTLSAVDFEQRTVRPVSLPQEVRHVELVNEERQHAGPLTNDYIFRVVARTDNHIYVLSLEGEIIQTLMLPPALRNVSFQLYNWWKPMFIGVSTDRTTLENHIYWVDQKGEITRTADLRLWDANDRDTNTWLIGLVAPSPPLLLVATFLDAGSHLQMGESPDYATALKKSFATMGSALLIACIVSAILAVLCYRRQRRYDSRSAAVWAIFVLVTGAPGYVGYLVHRRWPLVQRCEHCGSPTPRNKLECIRCGREMSRPELRQIEIFA